MSSRAIEDSTILLLKDAYNLQSGYSPKHESFYPPKEQAAILEAFAQRLSQMGKQADTASAQKKFKLMAKEMRQGQTTLQYWWWQERKDSPFNKIMARALALAAKHPSLEAFPQNSPLKKDKTRASALLVTASCEKEEIGVSQTGSEPSASSDDEALSSDSSSEGGFSGIKLTLNKENSTSSLNNI